MSEKWAPSVRHHEFNTLLSLRASHAMAGHKMTSDNHDGLISRMRNFTTRAVATVMEEKSNNTNNHLCLGF